MINTNKYWTQQEENILIKCYSTGGAEQLSKTLNKSISAIYHKSSRLGLHVQSLDLTLFDRWSFNLAWLLGYIWADGSVVDKGGADKDVNCVAFCSCLKDKELLLHVKKLLSAKQSIYYNSSTQSLHLRIYSIKLVNIIQSKYKIEPRKSYKNLPFPHIPRKYLGAFLRGYLDGDGCVYTRRGNKRNYITIIIAGQYQFLKGLCTAVHNILHTKHTKIVKCTNSKHCFIFRWNIQSDIRKLYNFMYPRENIPCLTRKRDSIKQCL